MEFKIIFHDRGRKPKWWWVLDARGVCSVDSLCCWNITIVLDLWGNIGKTLCRYILSMKEYMPTTAIKIEMVNCGAIHDDSWWYMVTILLIIIHDVLFVSPNAFIIIILLCKILIIFGAHCISYVKVKFPWGQTWDLFPWFVESWCGLVEVMAATFVRIQKWLMDFGVALFRMFDKLSFVCIAHFKRCKEIGTWKSY